MKSIYEPAVLVEKDRIRLQINAQVDEFLRCGGKINVVGGRDLERRQGIGVAWKDHDDLVDVPE